MADKAIEVLLDEKRNFSPTKKFKKSANVRSASVFNNARKNPQAFCATAAKELHWFKPRKKILEWNCPWTIWFIGGKINASYNCLDRHVKRMRDLTDLPCFTMSCNEAGGYNGNFIFGFHFK